MLEIQKKYKILLVTVHNEFSIGNKNEFFFYRENYQRFEGISGFDVIDDQDLVLCNLDTNPHKAVIADNDNKRLYSMEFNGVSRSSMAYSMELNKSDVNKLWGIHSDRKIIKMCTTHFDPKHDPEKISLWLLMDNKKVIKMDNNNAFEWKLCLKENGVWNRKVVRMNIIDIVSGWDMIIFVDENKMHFGHKVIMMDVIGSIK